jgi:hypothetical protein
MRLAAAVILLLATPAAAQRAWFTHVPPAEAPEGQAVTIEATIDQAWGSTLQLRFRAIGERTWRSEPFQRGTEEGAWRATIPAELVRAPGFEYFVVGAGKDGALETHFASEAAPHQVMVYLDQKTLLREQELVRVRRRYARARLSAEIVDFGKREAMVPGVGMREFQDYYRRLEAEFMYRVLRFPLHSMRFGVSHLLGATPGFEEPDPMGGTIDNPDCDLGVTCTTDVEAGYRAGGWVEFRLRLGSVVELDARGIVSGTPAGVNVGARFEGRIGAERGTHVALGWEGIIDTGFDVFMRLGWDTVPRFPMSTTISITTMPSPARDPAVRLVYDVLYPMDNGLAVGARLGYQARDQGIGGVTAGLNLSLDF